MKKVMAIMLAVLLVLSMSSVAFAVVGSQQGGVVAVKTKTGTPAQVVVVPLATDQQEAIKQLVAKLADSGLKANEKLGEVVAAAAMVISGDPKDAGEVGMNVSAALNGKTVAALVRLPDGTVKVLKLKVKDGAVQIPWDAAWGKKADVMVTELA